MRGWHLPQGTSTSFWKPTLHTRCRTDVGLTETACSSQVLKSSPFPSFFFLSWKAAMRSTLSIIFSTYTMRMKNWKRCWREVLLRCLILCFKKKSTYVFITSHMICFSCKVAEESLLTPTFSYFDFYLFQIPCPFFNKNSLSRCYVCPGTSNEMDKCRHSLCSPKT